MGFQWLLDDETPTPAPPALPTPHRRRLKVALIIAALASGAVAIALLWPRYRANQVLGSVEQDVRTALERELRAARDGDDEVFRALTGTRLDRAARDPATGLTPPLPGVQSLPDVDIRVRAIPPAVRGGRVESAEADLTYQIADGLGTGPYTEHRTLSIDEKGAWLSEPDAKARRAADAVRFRLSDSLASYLEIVDWVGPGRIRLYHEAGDAAEARDWYDTLAREVNAYCEARDAQVGPATGPENEPPCELHVSLSGAAGTVSNVTSSEVTHLVLPSPSAHGTLEPSTESVLRRTAARLAMASLARIPPFTEPWMNLGHGGPSVPLGARASDPVPGASSGAYGGRAALRAALLEIWLAHRGLVPDRPDASPHAGPEPSLVSLLADGAPAVPKGADLALANAARAAAAHVVAATGRDAIPALLAGYSQDPVEWLETVLPPDRADEVAAWPARPQPLPGPRIVLAACGGQYGAECWDCGTNDDVAFLPGSAKPVDLSEAACGEGASVTGLRWAPHGRHLGVTCASGEGRSVVVLDAATMSRVPPEERALNTTVAVDDLCCLSWSGDGARLSWLECCPVAPRVAEVGDTISARSPGEWTAGWAEAVYNSWEWLESELGVRLGTKDESRFGGAASGAVIAALESGSPPRLPFLANTGMAWAPSGTLAAVWDLQAGSSGAVDPYAGGYSVGDVEGDLLWRSPGHRPVWRPDGALVAEIEAFSGTGFSAVVRAADTGIVTSRLEMTADLLNQATGALGPGADYVEPNDVTFSSDGRWVVIPGRWWRDGRPPASGGNFVAAWDPQADVITVRAQPGVLLMVGWWPDGTVRLVTPGESGGTVVMSWDPETGLLEDRARLKRGAGTSPTDSSTILTSAEEGTLVLADLDGKELWSYRSRSCRPGSWQPAR